MNTTDKIHEATGINETVLLKDAMSLGINLLDGVNISTYRFALSMTDSYNKLPARPRKDDFKTWFVYLRGEVIGKNLTQEEKSHLIQEHPKAMTEFVLDDTSYRAALDKHNTDYTIVTQTFRHGLYYLENVMDHPKADRMFDIARDERSSWVESAEFFETLVDLF